MSIPFNDHLCWNAYCSNPDWYKSQPELLPEPSTEECLLGRATKELLTQTFKHSFVRGFQCIRDSARLVLKVPLRLIVLEKTWQQYERAKINAKLTGYSFVQLLFVPVKFCVALIAIATSAISSKNAKWLLDKIEQWTAHLDGRASQLEALKEEAGKNAQSPEEYNAYKNWLYSIDPKLCRKE